MARSYDQNFDIDIDKIYDDFIKDIDSIRSYVNIADGNNSKLLSNENLVANKIASTIQKLKVESSPQESRCHAFYRLIGFPVVSKDNIIYNPGLSNLNPLFSIPLSKRLEIAKNPIEKFNELSIFRETYVSKIKTLFSNNTTISASTLALSSVNVRDFISPLQIFPSIFDTKVNNQSYITSLDFSVGANEISLLQFRDVNGESPKLDNKRYHIIAPFIVDPRIDFTVSPSYNKVAVPFVFDNSNLKISETNFVKRPLIEKIIRDRFLNIDQVESAGTFDQNILSLIKANPSFKDVNIVNKIVNKDIYKLSEQLQFKKFFDIIQSMVSTLIKSMDVVGKIAAKYYYVPIPNKNGPEFGLTTDSVIISSHLPTNLVTSTDSDIVDLFYKTSINDLNSQTTSSTATPDTGNYSFSDFLSSFDQSSESFGNLGRESLEELVNIRTKEMNLANSAIREIEIIMGEFSGFGLCDIIAVLAALYVMPKESLTGFLDDAAYSRMITLVKFTNGPPEHASIETAMNDLLNYVKDFYNLMDKSYEDVLQNDNSKT